MRLSQQKSEQMSRNNQIVDLVVEASRKRIQILESRNQILFNMLKKWATIASVAIAVATGLFTVCLILILFLLPF